MYLNFGIFRSSKWKALINVHQVQILNLQQLGFFHGLHQILGLSRAQLRQRSPRRSCLQAFSNGKEVVTACQNTSPNIFQLVVLKISFLGKKSSNWSARSLGVSQLLQFIVKTTLQSSSTQSSSFQAKSDDSLASQLPQFVVKTIFPMPGHLIFRISGRNPRPGNTFLATTNVCFNFFISKILAPRFSQHPHQSPIRTTSTTYKGAAYT